LPIVLLVEAVVLEADCPWLNSGRQSGCQRCKRWPGM